MRKWKRNAALTAVAAAMLSGSLNVSAAGVRDVFDAEYYADSYADLKAAFGVNEELLYQHYMTVGLREGRSGSKVFDAAEYRRAYGDLDAIFGDDWDAYVNHYCTVGRTEGRTAGVYGEINLNRDNSSEADADKDKAENKTENTNENSAMPVYPPALRYMDMQPPALDVVWYRGEELEDEAGDIVGFRGYDAAGNIIKVIWYDENGKAYNTHAYEYDESGRTTKSVTYDGDGILREKGYYIYDEFGRKIEGASYENYGWREKLWRGNYYEYDELGRATMEVTYNEDGATKVECGEYIGETQFKSRNIVYDLTDGSRSVWEDPELLYNGDTIVDSSYKRVTTYYTDGSWTVADDPKFSYLSWKRNLEFGMTTYQRITEYNPDGSIKSQRSNSNPYKYR